MARKRNNKNLAAMRFVKFLAICRDPKASSATIKAAPDRAIKIISNAALNAHKGGVKFGKGQIAFLRKALRGKEIRSVS